MTGIIVTLFFCALIAPPLAAIVGRWSGVAAGSFLLALSSAFIGGITWAQWLECLLVLWTFLLAIGFLVLLLMRLGCGRVGSCAIVSILVIAWLTAPVWLSGALAGQRLHWSVMLHPLFVMNGIAPQLGIWTEQQVAYKLTSIGQDVQYDLPGSCWPFVGSQLAIAVASWVAGRNSNDEIRSLE